MKKKLLCILIVTSLLVSACCMTACGTDAVASLAVRGQTRYIVGDGFAGASLTVIYESGKREQIDVTEQMMSGFDTSVAGEKTVVISYKGKTAELVLTVSDMYAYAIAVTQDSVTEYLKGSEYSDGDAKIDVIYTDGSTRSTSVTSDMLSGFDTSAVGNVSVSVIYGRLQTTYDISVRDARVTEMTLDPSSRTVYRVGDAFGGASFDVTYEDGTTATVTLDDESSLGGFDTTEEGTKTVRAFYRNMATAFDITVLKAVSDVTLASYDELYGVGDAFGSATLDVTYADGSKETVAVTDDMLAEFDTSSGGTRTVKVDFEGRKLLTYQILVAGRLEKADKSESGAYKLQAEDEDYTDMSEAVLQDSAVIKFENTTQKAGTNEAYPNGAEGYSTCNISVEGNKVTIRFISEVSGKFILGLRGQSGSGSGRQDTDISAAWSMSVNGSPVKISGTLKAACASNTNWKDMTIWTELTDIAGELTLVEGLNTVELTFLQPTASTIRFPNVDYFTVTVL